MATQQEYFYREARPNDKEQLKTLALSSYGQYRELLGAEHWQRLKDGVNKDELWKSLIHGSHSFLCTHHNKIIGMAYLVPSGNPWDIFQADWSYIRMVGVDPRYAGKGIGKRLTSMCIDKARDSKEKIIALHTSEIMPAARHIYESFGFKVLKEIPLRLGKRYWLYTLEL